MSFDAIDWKILSILQADGRISNQDLADRVGLSPSPCLRRVKALEAAGVIQRYAAMLNPAAVGQGLHAVVEVRLERQTSDTVARFEKEILKFPQVLECHLMAGDWDYELRVVARDLDDFREFCVNRLARIAGVGNVEHFDEAGEVLDGAPAPVRRAISSRSAD
jgi:Lrp/AsnC family leucine-responsive transcriptional regulator